VVFFEKAFVSLVIWSVTLLFEYYKGSKKVDGVPNNDDSFSPFAKE